MEILEEILSGKIRIVSRLLTDLENNIPYAIEELGNLYQHTGNAHFVGITGAPGVGKSTLIDALSQEFRKKGLTIGILAIDPTSPFSGGALLGDRIRMDKLSTDDGIFIRSLATRGGTGGLSRAALNMAYVLDAMGKDIVIIETVGIGQSEIDITKIADTSVLVLVPGMGDTIQLMKAGILEATDIIVINKADLSGSDSLRMELQSVINPEQCPPILLTEAILNQGSKDVVDSIIEHHEAILESGELRIRRQKRARYEILQAIEYTLNTVIESEMKGDIEKLSNEVVDRKMPPHSAAKTLFKQFSKILIPED